MLLGTWSLLRNCMLPVSCGSQTPRDTSTSFSAILGLIRSTCTSRFCSRATCTASSMVSRRLGPPPFCSRIGAACEAGVVAVPCPAGVGAGGTGCADGAGRRRTRRRCGLPLRRWGRRGLGGRRLGGGGLCGRGRRLSESGRGNRRHHERHERGSHYDIRPGVHLRQSPGIFLAARVPTGSGPPTLPMQEAGRLGRGRNRTDRRTGPAHGSNRTPPRSTGLRPFGPRPPARRGRPGRIV